MQHLQILLLQILQKLSVQQHQILILHKIQIHLDHHLQQLELKQ
jgi:hypothetical protein